MCNSTDIQNRFLALGEYYAAGFYEEVDVAPFRRFSRAHRRYLENYKLQEYNNELLYPCGAINQGLLVGHDFSFTVYADFYNLYKKDAVAAEALQNDLSKFYSSVPPEHAVGGNIYTHSYPNFKRIISEGLDSYEERVKLIEDEDIRLGLLDLLCGIRTLHRRILTYIYEKAPDSELYKALLNVPFKPAANLYEALVSWNFIYYIDGCDDIGQPDMDFIKYYNGEDMTEVFRQFFKNVDANNGWSGTLGPEYNELTLQCLKAIKGIRRPSLELLVNENMPQEVWKLAIESIAAGGGSPSLYNHSAYIKELNKLFPEIPEEDLLHFGGGGCTETMLAGLSNVGSLDAGINLALIFENVMQQKLKDSANFEEFYNELLSECEKTVEIVTNAICDSQKRRAEHRPHPVRTLLIDDCIDKGKDFNNGGARYTWSVVNLAGMINVIDSLLVIKKLIFDESVMSAAEFLERLACGDSFKQYKNTSRHGVDNSEANMLAKRFSSDVCKYFEDKRTYFDSKFLPASIQFTTFIEAGKNVASTPDGRGFGDALCDSIGAIHNNDTKGITALLNSAAAIAQDKMVGTPVLNIKLDATKNADYIEPLIKGYFNNGGMQVQITCINKDELIAAKENPEKYPNLIVRIGGYSEYFNRLSPEHMQAVIDRSIYG